MAEKSTKKKYIPDYLWTKSPPKPSPLQTGFVNNQQKLFYVVITALRIAKVLAVAVVALFIIGWL